MDHLNFDMILRSQLQGLIASGFNFHPAMAPKSTQPAKKWSGFTSESLTFYIGPGSVFQFIPELPKRNPRFFKDLKVAIPKRKKFSIACSKILRFPIPDYASVSQRTSDGSNKVPFRRNDT